jgi:hypothetical protein
MRCMTLSAFSASLNNLRLSSIPTSLAKSLKLGKLLRQEHLLDSDPLTPWEALVSAAKSPEFSRSAIPLSALTLTLEIFHIYTYMKITKYLLRRSMINTLTICLFFYFTATKGHVRSWRSLLAEYIDLLDMCGLWVKPYSEPCTTTRLFRKRYVICTIITTMLICLTFF